MKRIKSACVLFLSIILILSMFITACSGQTDKGGSKDSDTKKTQEGQSPLDASKLDPVRLIMTVPGTPQQDQSLVNDAISKYLKDDLNVTIDLQQIDWASWGDKSNLIIASGEECDILFTAPWTQYEVNAVKGAFHELDDLIPQYAPDLLKTNYTWLLDVAKINGKIYAIPTYQILAQSRGFILRKDLVDKYGPEVNFTVKEVNKPEDLEPLLRVIKKNEPGIIPYYGNPSKLLSFMGPWDRQGSTEPTAINCYDEYPRYVNFYDNDFYRECARIARRWFVDGLVNSDIATTKEDASSIFAAGKAFCFSGQTNPAEKSSIENAVGYKIVMYPLIKPIISTSLARGAMFSIPRQSSNRERALMFLNRLHTDKNLVNMFVYGIEGKHYVFKDDSRQIIEPAPGIDPSKNPYFNLIWMFGNQSLLYAYGEENVNAANDLDNFNQNAVKSPALGFSYNPEAMKNEIAALTNIVLEYDPVISSGAVDMNKDGLYQKFLQKLKAAGIDRLLEDQNKQLEEWLKNK